MSVTRNWYFFTICLRLGNLARAEIHQILVPQAAHFDPLHSEFAGGYEAGMVEVLEISSVMTAILNCDCRRGTAG